MLTGKKDNQKLIICNRIQAMNCENIQIQIIDLSGNVFNAEYKRTTNNNINTFIKLIARQISQLAIFSISYSLIDGNLKVKLLTQ